MSSSSSPLARTQKKKWEKGSHHGSSSAVLRPAISGEEGLSNSLESSVVMGHSPVDGEGWRASQTVVGRHRRCHPLDDGGSMHPWALGGGVQMAAMSLQRWRRASKYCCWGDSAGDLWSLWVVFGEDEGDSERLRSSRQVLLTDAVELHRWRDAMESPSFVDDGGDWIDKVPWSRRW